MAAAMSDDPAYIQAAESLLASRDTIEVTHRSPKQEALRIPPRLIGIATMCDGDKNLFEFLLRQDETIQEQYSYSPTLLPMREVDRERIAVALQKRMVDLRLFSDQCAAQLAKEAADEEHCVKDRMDRKRQSKRKQKPKEPLEVSEPLVTGDDEDDSLSDHSLAELSRLATRHRNAIRSTSTTKARGKSTSSSHTQIENQVSSDSSWTIVSKFSSKLSKITAESTTQPLELGEPLESSKPTLSPTRNAITPHVDSPTWLSNMPEASETGTTRDVPPRSLRAERQGDDKQTATDDGHDGVCDRNIADEASDLRQQVAKERQEATRLQAVLVEKDAIIQNLQLRLYISETRLRTYEDALKEHMDQVQRNLATEHSNDQSQPYHKAESTLLKKGFVRRT